MLSQYLGALLCRLLQVCQLAFYQTGFTCCYQNHPFISVFDQFDLLAYWISKMIFYWSNRYLVNLYNVCWKWAFIDDI